MYRYLERDSKDIFKGVTGMLIDDFGSLFQPFPIDPHDTIIGRRVMAMSSARKQHRGSLATKEQKYDKIRNDFLHRNGKYNAIEYPGQVALVGAVLILYIDNADDSTLYNEHAVVKKLMNKYLEPTALTNRLVPHVTLGRIDTTDECVQEVISHQASELVGHYIIGTDEPLLFGKATSAIRAT